MATFATAPAAAAAPAPWRSDLLDHIQAMDEPSFVLTTLHPPSASWPLGSPRARTVIFRGMWCGLPVDPRNPAELNPGVFVSDLLTITTDARMEKVPELLAGQGPFEAVFWMPQSRTQWRLRGHAFIVGPDIDSDAAAPVRDALRGHMRSRGGDEASWSWSRELTAHFGNLSPAMRGSFRNPAPGTPLTETPGEGEGLGQTVEDLEDPVARRNFRVVVLVPDELDRVDLSDPKRGRRWSYKRTTLEGNHPDRWEVTERWP